MKNWLGQDIKVGSPVYRGARQGNTSEYKVGIVESIKGNKIRVNWKYTHSSLWELVDRGAVWADGSPRKDRDFVAYVPRLIDSKGGPGIDSLILLPEADLLRLDAVYALVTEWNDRLDKNVMSKGEFIDRMNDF